MTIATVTERGKRRHQQQQEVDRRRSVEASAAAGEVLVRFGERPAVADPARRQAASESLLFWLSESRYFPHSTGKAPLCSEQLDMISRLEGCFNAGGKTAHAGFRGCAKSAIHELSALWALLTGRRRFLAWFGATAPIAKAASHSILIELCENEELAADWPDACWLFRALEGNWQRTRNQKYAGVRTYLSTQATKIVIPMLESDGKIARWACMITKGLNAEDAARAQRWKTPAGENLRPDAIVVDDPLSDKSAKSQQAVSDRLKLITESLAHSGSRDETMSLCVAGNVIEPVDVMDQLLDPERYPDFSGARIPQLLSFPDAKDSLWTEYATIRSRFDKTVPGDRQRAIDKANEFYAASRDAMNTGGRATWEHAYRPKGGEFNALHAAMNEWSDLREDAFNASCQQQPADREELAGTIRFPDDSTRRQTKLPRGICPADTQTVTIGIDVQQDVMFWLAVAWQQGFSGHIVDYGVFPDQRKKRFALNKLRHTLRQQYPGAGVEGAIFSGIRELAGKLVGREWRTSAGQRVHVGKMLVDAGFQTTTVYRAVEQSGMPTVLIPCKGFSLTAVKKPMSEWRVTPGARKGENWMVRRPEGQQIRIVEADVNAWKTFLHRRFETPVGDHGSLMVYGDGKTDHGMLQEHLSVERGIVATAFGRSIYEWTCPPHADQHWFDCLVYAAVGASVEGVSLTGHEPPRTKPKLKLSDIQRKKRGG